MTRVLSSVVVSTCAVVLLAFAGGSAWAGPKPTIAVLGLEVADSGTGIDPETTRVAKDLTAALRGRPISNAGPYALAPNGEKELIDEKLLNNCDTEAPVCMSAIGVELGADVLLYGKIEKKPAAAGAAPTYQVSLKLLYVSRKQVSSVQETLPQSDAATPRAAGYAKSWYARLVGGVSGGTVAVKANVDRGTVLIDDEAKGTLASGALSLPGIPEGRHTLAIEAKDYQRYESSITVRNGETLSHTATLATMSKTAPAPTATNVAVAPAPTATSKSNVWKPIFYTAAGLDVAAIGYTLYEFYSIPDKVSVPGGTDGQKYDNSQCGKVKGSSDFDSACDKYSHYKTGVIVSSVLGAAVVGTFFMAFVRDRLGSHEAQASTGHKKRREFAITPIVSPDGGGATLQIDW